MPRIRSFTPQREDASVLADRTVGRDRLLATLERTFRSAARKANRNHTLLIGPRGSGKSHVIEVALNALRDQPALAERFAIVRIPEDAVGFISVERITARIAAELGTAAKGNLAELQQGIHEALSGRVLLLVVENLDRVMRAIGSGGQRDLRSWVETSGDVLMLASTPLLFPGVQDREKPWYGAFAQIAVPPLTPEEGHDLLIRLALEHGETPTADYLATDKGRARVRAMAELTGGSPRIWTILYGCITPASLDALLPAVHDLLEDLVPYYQQLLWDLPPTEQVVVEAMATGQHAAMTVSEVAAATGLGQPQVSKVLRNLAADKWVVAEKLPAGDQRRTWYQLREPLLRHHFQYRAGDSRILGLIVMILREYFDPDQRRELLLEAPIGAPSFHHLAATYTEHRRGDSAWAARDLDRLREEARLWIAEGGERAGVGRTLDRLADGVVDRDVFGALLTEELSRTAPSPEPWMVLAEACWNGHAAPEQSRATCAELVESSTPGTPISLQAREECAYWTARCGDDATARDLYADLATDRTRTLGPEHPDTLDTRSWHALETSRCGDHQAARDLYADLAADQTRVLGPDHPATLDTRSWHALETSRCGDHQAARDLYADLAADQTRVLGPDHPVTLDTRMAHAAEVTRCGDEGDTARRLFADLAADRARVLGPDHPDTLDTRTWHGLEAAKYDDPTTARDLFADLAADQARILGPDHPDTLDSRKWHAIETGASGDHTTARDLVADLAADRARILGPDHPDTLDSRKWHAIETGESGDPTTARDLFADLAADQARILGPDHPDTLDSRKWHAIQTSKCGDHTTARDLYADLAADRARILGPDHPDTLDSRKRHAIQTSKCGDHTTARDLYADLAADQARILGPDHPDTLDSRDQHAVSAALAGDPIAGAREAWDVARASDFQRSVAPLMRIARLLPGQSAPPDAPEPLRSLFDAVSGSGDAELRLPAELRSMVKRLQERP